MTKAAGEKYVVGVDLGGTNVRASVISRDATEVAHVKTDSEAKSGIGRVVQRLVDTVNEAIGKAPGVTRESVVAVGVAVPGHIDTASGVILWSPNMGETVDGQFRMFLNVPFCEPISKKLGVPVVAGNDANVAALGEFAYGAGRGVSDMVMLTLGTGIGSGVISSGKMVTGSTGGAVEFGHHVIVAGGRQCGCGTFGCLEAYCGKSAIVERALAKIEKNRSSLLFDKILKDKIAFSPADIDEAAKQGDQAALEVFEETGYYLGVGLGNAVNMFNPRKIVLGGGIRNATGLLEAAERSMRRHSIYSLAHTCEIVAAELGDDAGIKGAAALAWDAVATP